MPDFLSNALANTWQQLQIVAVIYCAGLALESLRPAEPEQPIAHIRFNIFYTVLFLFVANLAVPPLAELTKPVIALYGLKIPVRFPDAFGWQVLQALAFLFIYDFFYYWFHRSQHTFPWLWAQHKIHHSERSVNATTGNRHHWLEEPIRVFVVLLPIGLLFDQKPVTIAAIWTGLTLWGYFIHMNVRLDLGPLTPVFAGPHLHRIHHSLEPDHRDRNYAAFFPIYDIAFGTYRPPAKDEYPQTGLDTGEDLNGIARASLAPFRAWFGGRARASLPSSEAPHDTPRL
jgi:sterol desaturase/sphingolipid hydroxylase (fatty acid hydroxylase superfamily)